MNIEIIAPDTETAEAVARVIRERTGETPTRPLAERITQGRATIADEIANEGIWIEGGNPDEPDEICLVSQATVAPAEAEANASLIAEAFTITHETGRTPRQLADDRAALIAALADCAESLSRLPDVDGAYRATCYQQAAKTLANVIAPINS